MKICTRCVLFLGTLLFLECSTAKVMNKTIVANFDKEFTDNYIIILNPLTPPPSFNWLKQNGKEMHQKFWYEEEFGVFNQSVLLSLKNNMPASSVFKKGEIDPLSQTKPVYELQINFEIMRGELRIIQGGMYSYVVFNGSFQINDSMGSEVYNKPFDIEIPPSPELNTTSKMKYYAASKVIEYFLDELQEFDTQLSNNAFDVAQSENIVYVKWTPNESVGTIYFPSYVSYTDASSSIDMIDHGYKVDWGPFSVTPYFLESTDDLNRVDSTHLLSVFESVSSTNSYIKLVYPMGEIGDWIVKPTRSWHTIPMKNDNPQETGIEWMLSDNILKEFIKGEYEGENWLALNSNNPETGESIKIPMFNHDGAQYFGVSYFNEGTETTHPSISKVSVLGSHQGYLIISVYQFELEQMTFDIAQQLYSKLTENFEAGVPYFRMGQMLE
jgi:hypothetical protein